MIQLLKLRKETKKTQQEIADFLEVTKQAYSRYERGERELNYARLIKLSKYFDVSIDYLLGNSTYYYPDAIQAKALDQNEEELLSLYRQLPEGLQQNALEVIRTLSGINQHPLQKRI